MPPSPSWYTASTEAEQAAVLDALARRGSGEDGTPRRARLGAVSELIELCHLARHPRARVPIIAALGRCTGQVIAIPALHAELDAPHPEVVAAALQAIGRVGLAFGGALVARWLDQQDAAALAPPVLAAALLALGRTGSPAVEVRAEQASRMGLLPPSQVHLALAEACSLALLDEARAALSEPSCAHAAALHLAAARVPDLADLLAPLLSGDDAALALLAEQLLRVPRPSVEDDVVAVLGTRLGPARRARLARGLRAHPPDQVVAAFHLLAEGLALSAPEAEDIVQLALEAGIPELQDAALTLAAQGPPTLLKRSLRHAHAPTPVLRAALPAWIDHPEPEVSTAAVRAYLNLFGDQALVATEGLDRSPRAEQRLEWVRLQQNAYRDRLDAHGRSTLGHARRQQLSTRLRRLVREDPDAKVVELALYAAGNIGLTELADELGRHLDPSWPWQLRRAAATALAEFPALGQLDTLTAALSIEDNDDVLFRVLRALLRAVEADPRPRPDLADLAIARLPAATPRCRALLLALLGESRDPRWAARLSQEAERSPALAIAGAAVTALGRLGAPQGLGAVLEASRSPSGELRLRAAEALGGIGGAVAADRLAALLCTADEGTDVRTAALQALAGLEPDAALLSGLAPIGLDDPLALDILQLRLQASGAAAGAADIDARLVAAAPGLDLAQLAQRHGDALRALRTAEFFYLPGVSLPEGLDAAPPVLFWVKGLELWLGSHLRPLLRELAHADLQLPLFELGERWDRHRDRLAPGWRDDLLAVGQGDHFAKLGEGLAREIRRHTRASRTPSLRLVGAALLLLAAPEDLEPALPRAELGLPHPQVVGLANRLVMLAARRNKLTHQAAGHGGDNDEVRRVALEAAGLAGRVVVRGGA